MEKNERKHFQTSMKALLEEFLTKKKKKKKKGEKNVISLSTFPDATIEDIISPKVAFVLQSLFRI